MTSIIFTKAKLLDVPHLSRIRGNNLSAEKCWYNRISGYINGTHHPQNALPEREIFIAKLNGAIIGFIAGHLTTRFNCNGELQWINVIEKHQGSGIASDLLEILANWFVSNRANKICVNFGSEQAKKFYLKNGAEMLNEHWMFWQDISSRKKL